MSNDQQPPSYGGHSSYAQWAPPYPGMIPPPPNLPPGQHPPNPPHLMNPVAQPFQHGVDPNASAFIPPQGAPVDPGLFYPPQFSYMPPFNPSQIAPHQFPPIAMPPFGFPQMLAPPPGSSQTLLGASDAQSADASRAQTSQAQTRAPSYTNSLHEEGEVDDENSSAVYTTKASKPTNPSRLDQIPSAQNDDLEEGEQLSSRTSSRSSSPYNPPLSVSADPDVVNRAIEMQKREVTTATSEESQPPKSAAQLRVQAQGALLSLAPHNIRYEELVAEGINPTLLKQLYEEVGIRIATPKAEKKAGSTTIPAKPPQGPSLKNSVPQPAQPAEPTKNTEVPVLASSKVENESKMAATDSSKTTPTAPPMGSNKPMERKEVIARMLAEKAAARATEPQDTPKVTPKVTPKSSPSAVSSTATPAKLNGTGVKEKNKAQTELARQRIEQLRKQALMKQQEKNRQPSQTMTVPGQVPESSVPNEVATPVPAHTPAADPVPAPVPAPAPAPTIARTQVVQHPLPVRPPASADVSKIPGLLLAGSDQESTQPNNPSVSQDIGVDSTPLSRTSQRKRPRASDFDEPPDLPKKPFSYSTAPSDSESRLIIDISEDESLYGDDEGADMDVDSSSEQEPASAPSLAVPKPPLSRNSSRGGLSSSTPQSHDSESLRKRDLQIQAMHRRIAELEQKRKEKLAASRTQSPLPLVASTPSSEEQSTATGAEIFETSSAPVSTSKLAPDTCTSVSTLADRPDLIDTFCESSIRVLASMDMSQLDKIRSQILRMKEIESGLPELDAEIESSEQRLATCKREADTLLAEITKGKEGRLQLVDELKKLSDEINGLTLEDLDELRRQAEIKEQHLATQAVSSANSSAGAEDGVVLSAQVPFSPGAAAGVSQTQVNGATEGMDDTREAESMSDSSSTGSSMDESSDSESSGDNPSDQEEEEEEEEELDTSSPLPDTITGPQATSEPSIDHLNTEVPCNALPDRPQSVAEDVDMVDNEHDESQQKETEQSRRETSAESDDYEPP
ncbi:uncharacterized protein N7469_002576 [Penicillium citrinum]|uniref:Uncharacterized protein n=1 Tax=Penicillium citrinum TaxID=5077 RepID=A0A9W9TTN2_PENCI|nr:uncharacterized protein N7469_002576 [Penicillium citrinum]KAJ5240985.1 hypothetical protein N7469_002576 [Penicillium citrinum]